MQIRGIIETAIYVRDLDETEEFYSTVLSLPVITKQPGRHVFFQVGTSTVLLAFLADTTSRDERTPHGTKGAGHFALGIETAALEASRQKLSESGVMIEDQVTWPRGGRSIYFRDPSGNSVELITRGVWGLPSGW